MGLVFLALLCGTFLTEVEGQVMENSTEMESVEPADEEDAFFRGLMSLRQEVFPSSLIILVYSGFALFLLAKYFVVPSCDVIMQKSGSSPSVAGTLIFGSVTSALGFVTSLIATFVALGNVSIAKIMGSHLYDYTMVVGLSIVFVPAGVLKIVALRPLFRDVAFAFVVHVLLVLFFLDGSLAVYEALILVGSFFLYLVLVRVLRRFMGASGPNQSVGDPIELGGEAANQDENQASDPKTEELLSLSWPQSDSCCSCCCACCFSPCCAQTRHIFLFPIKMLLIATIPSPAWACCKCTWEKVFPLTLLVSLAWHAALSYLIAQSGRVFGLVVGIPPEFNGIVLLAPFSLDLMCCLVLVRRGDLAIALHSVVGRTIIQMCLTLGISRALFSIVFAEATEVMVAGASYSMIVWILAVALLLLVVGVSRGLPGKAWSIIFIVLYLLHAAAAIALAYGWIQIPI